MEAVLEAEPLFMIKISKNSLTTGLKNATMYVDSLKTFFLSKVTIENINTGDKTTSLAKLIASTINHAFFDFEVGLPLAKPINDSISSTRLFIYDNFLLIDSIEVIYPVNND